ncbi:hypothetical protein LBMAG33_1780 [Candidatus Levyibacteriota bacterium]|nr:hypothetical protein LBMAG33_1780 [Candidatus Levybacteria bacterium]
MRNKIILIIIILIVIIGVCYSFYVSRLVSPPPKVEIVVEEKIDTLSASDLNLVFISRSDKKAVKFSIDNTEGIENVEYQIGYTKELEGEQIPEGLIGEVKPKNGKIMIDYRELGTCSVKVCRYDKVISDIKLILKIIKSGKSYQSEISLSL